MTVPDSLYFRSSLIRQDEQRDRFGTAHAAQAEIEPWPSSEVSVDVREQDVTTRPFS